MSTDNLLGVRAIARSATNEGCRMKSSISIGQIVHDRTRSVAKGAAIVVGMAPRPGQLRICRWRGGDQHWMSPIIVDAKQIAPIDDWTRLPLTEAKRLAAAAFERNYLVRVMAFVQGPLIKASLVEAARLAVIDRSNFRRLLQRHGLIKMRSRSRRRSRAVWQRRKGKA